MSRKRDTNWNRDEITVLLDSILEITRMRAEDGKRTNSREVFEYAAKKLGEKGHTSRAEREKCRTKWKKMKEEFTHAKKAREGDAKYKEAPGIQPFYDRMKEFINGNFDNISPHSTIVRRSSNISSSNNTTSNATTASSSSNNGTKASPGPRASARIAANSTCASVAGASEVNGFREGARDLSKQIDTATVAAISQQQQQAQDHTPPTSTPYNLSSHQSSSRVSSGSDSNTNNSSNSMLPSSSSSSAVINNNVTNGNLNVPLTLDSNRHHNQHQHQDQHNLAHHETHQHQQHNQRQPNNYSQQNHAQHRLQHQAHSTQHQAIPNGESIGFNMYNNNSTHSGNNPQGSSNTSTGLAPTTNSKHQINASNNLSSLNNNGANGDLYSPAAPGNPYPQPSLHAEHADISYRVSTGCRQITIFGDHDVDIKFRGDCVTINKISTECSNAASNFKTHHTNSGNSLINAPRAIDDDDCL